MITVKPLEWKQNVIGDGTVLRQKAWFASHYQIIESPSGKYDLRGDTYAICDTLEEAQAAAFADYSARIMSAIEPACVKPQSVEGSPLLEWAVERWKAEVKHRPLRNVHRRSLDDVWRQVICWAGGDPIQLVGPSHDQLLSEGNAK